MKKKIALAASTAKYLICLLLLAHTKGFNSPKEGQRVFDVYGIPDPSLLLHIFAAVIRVPNFLVLTFL